MTFLFTDIEGSTALLTRLGDVIYAETLAHHHRLIRASLSAHDGKEISMQGDGFFAVFSSPRACLAAVIDMQRAIATHEWPSGEQVRVRMGVHCGEASDTSAGLVGLDVHRAARIGAVAHGGQILLSATAAGLVRDSLPAGTSLRDLGLHRLKDLGRPEQIFQLQGEGLEFEFPPLRSLDNPELPNNLPAQSAPFVGRSLEVAVVRRLVESARLVTLTGAGGSGKTRLCLQVAADLLDGSGDGVWLVELAPVSEQGAVASAISQALGIKSQAGRPALETLLDALSSQYVLIVLDNCEHLIDDCAKVADAILRRCPRVHLMTTSREPLGIGGETIYRVPSLSLPGPDEVDASGAEASDAVALFMDRARAQAVDLVLNEETSSPVVSICRRLDGMPLAIELAAARLRSLSLESLHDRLDQRFRLLTGGSRSALPRQQTLRATVDWSYSLLNSPEQSLLRRLSVFAEGFDLEAAEAVCALGDIEVFEVTDLLGSLVDKSMVMVEPSDGAVRYRLLETIRQFAAERLVEADEEEALALAEAHCAHFLALAEEADTELWGPNQGRWYKRLRSEEANIRRAIQYAAADRDGARVVMRFTIALRRHWWVQEHGGESYDTVLEVLGRPEAHSEPALLARALAAFAFSADHRDLLTARRLAEQGLEIAREVGAPEPMIEALHACCAMAAFSGDNATGLELGKEGVRRARQFGNDTLLALVLSMCLLCTYYVEPERSGELFSEAVALVRSGRDWYLTSILYNNAANTALIRDDIPAARAHLEEARRAEREAGLEVGHHRINFGWVLREQGDRDAAQALFEVSLREGRRGGDPQVVAFSVLALACLAGDRERWHDATVLHGMAEALFEQIARPVLEPEARYRSQSIERVANHLGKEFGSVFAEGKGRGPAEALDVALGKVVVATGD